MFTLGGVDIETDVLSAIGMVMEVGGLQDGDALLGIGSPAILRAASRAGGHAKSSNKPHHQGACTR